MLYLGLMRYPDGGGLTAAGRVRREAVRLQAAEWFDQDVPVPEIAQSTGGWHAPARLHSRSPKRRRESARKR
jgi:hypothetical protein